MVTFWSTANVRTAVTADNNATPAINANDFFIARSFPLGLLSSARLTLHRQYLPCGVQNSSWRKCLKSLSNLRIFMGLEHLPSHFRSPVLPAAMLVFFAAAAGTGIVAPDFRSGADRFGLFAGRHGFGNHLAALGRRRFSAGGGPAERAGGLVHRLLRHAAQELLERHQAGSAAEDVVANLRLDVDHQLIEHLESFGFVFDERIALAVSAQPDAVAQAVHAIKVFLP